MSRSITPAPSGSLSPDFITVPSTTGFSAGDYVYQKDGDFGLPPNATSANFSVTLPSPIYGATVGGTSTPVNWYGGTGLSTIGSSTGECAAKLSNGNIVIVYGNSGARPSFRIVTTDNVAVVADTFLVNNSSLSVTQPIGVVALTGGGFAAYWYSILTNKVAYAIYTNAGTVTTPYTSDSTYPTTASPNQPIYGCALPNGGFALAVIGFTVQNAYLRAYNATGVGAYGWVSLGTAYAASQNIGIAARSDNSVCVAYQTTATALAYAVYNSSGGSIAVSSITNTNGPRACSVVCLPNDTFVIGYRADGNTSSYSFRLLPTGNVLSSAFTVPVTNMVAGADVNTLMFLKELSSGGFVYFMTDGYRGMYYMFYTSAGVAVYAGPKALPQIIYRLPYQRLGGVEISGYLSLYHAGTVDPSSTTIQPYELYNTKISLTNYELLSSVTTTTQVGTVSSSAGAYARSTSLPMKAAYLASNTETLALNQVMSTGNNYTLAPGAVDSSSVDSIKSTTLPDGRFAIVYKNASTGAVSFNVYSIAGILQTTVSVGTGSTGSAARVRIAALSSGKIVVGYQTLGAASVTLALYSAAFGLIATTTKTTDASPRFDLAGLPGDRFVLAFTNASANPDSTVYDNTAAVVSNVGPPGSDASVTTLSVGVSSNGTYWMAWAYASAARYVCYYQSSATLYAQIVGQFSYGGTLNTVMPCQVAVNSAGIATFMSASVNTNLQLYTSSVNCSSSPVLTATITSMTTVSWADGNGAIGATGAGTFLFFGSGNATANLYGFTGSALSSVGSLPSGLLSGITRSASYGMQACITPSYGYNAVIAWINSSNIAQYAIVNAYPFGATQAVTAGVTGSAPTTPLNISQSSGYYLAGVAVSDCPAGGTGQIQTNGVANLNSQYSASTAFQGFDFQNPVTVGVKGTAVGRTVTMIKD